MVYRQLQIRERGIGPDVAQEGEGQTTAMGRAANIGVGDDDNFFPFFLVQVAAMDLVSGSTRAGELACDRPDQRFMTSVTPL